MRFKFLFIQALLIAFASGFMPLKNIARTRINTNTQNNTNSSNRSDAGNGKVIHSTKLDYNQIIKSNIKHQELINDKYKNSSKVVIDNNDLKSGGIINYNYTISYSGYDSSGNIVKYSQDSNGYTAQNYVLGSDSGEGHSNLGAYVATNDIFDIKIHINDGVGLQGNTTALLDQKYADIIRYQASTSYKNPKNIWYSIHATGIETCPRIELVQHWTSDGSDKINSATIGMFGVYNFYMANSAWCISAVSTLAFLVMIPTMATLIGGAYSITKRLYQFYKSFNSIDEIANASAATLDVVNNAEHSALDSENTDRVGEANNDQNNNQHENVSNGLAVNATVHSENVRNADDTVSLSSNNSENDDISNNVTGNDDGTGASLYSSLHTLDSNFVDIDSTITETEDEYVKLQQALFNIDYNLRKASDRLNRFTQISKNRNEWYTVKISEMTNEYWGLKSELNDLNNELNRLVAIQQSEIDSEILIKTQIQELKSKITALKENITLNLSKSTKSLVKLEKDKNALIKTLLNDYEESPLWLSNLHIDQESFTHRIYLSNDVSLNNNNLKILIDQEGLVKTEILELEEHISYRNNMIDSMLDNNNDASSTVNGKLSEGQISNVHKVISSIENEKSLITTKIEKLQIILENIENEKTLFQSIIKQQEEITIAENQITELRFEYNEKFEYVYISQESISNEMEENDKIMNIRDEINYKNIQIQNIRQELFDIKLQYVENTDSFYNKYIKNGYYGDFLKKLYKWKNDTANLKIFVMENKTYSQNSYLIEKINLLDKEIEGNIISLQDLNQQLLLASHKNIEEMENVLFDSKLIQNNGDNFQENLTALFLSLKACKKDFEVTSRSVNNVIDDITDKINQGIGENKDLGLINQRKAIIHEYVEVNSNLKELIETAKYSSYDYKNEINALKIRRQELEFLYSRVQMRIKEILNEIDIAYSINKNYYDKVILDKDNASDAINNFSKHYDTTIYINHKGAKDTLFRHFDKYKTDFYKYSNSVDKSFNVLKEFRITILNSFSEGDDIISGIRGDLEIKIKNIREKVDSLSSRIHAISEKNIEDKIDFSIFQEYNENSAIVEQMSDLLKIKGNNTQENIIKIQNASKKCSDLLQKYSQIDNELNENEEMLLAIINEINSVRFEINNFEQDINIETIKKLASTIDNEQLAIALSNDVEAIMYDIHDLNSQANILNGKANMSLNNIKAVHDDFNSEYRKQIK